MVRQLLFKLLGFHNYLRFISGIFIRTFRMGIFLPDHVQVRFLGNLLRKGDTCIDIGANLGYFSVPMSHYVGTNGKVFSVEPVPAFREVLEGNLVKFALPNVEVLPFALGDTDGQKVYMGTPRVDGIVRHGRTEVLDAGDSDGIAIKHEALMRRPDTLFANLSRLDFIKCDVEGYELHIVPHLLPIIQQHLPIIEIEAAPADHKKQLIDILLPLGYAVFFLENGKLIDFNPEKPGHQKEIELYFLPKNKINTFSNILGK